MEKKIMKTLVIMLMFLLLAPLSYAENVDLADYDIELTEPSVDGIYRRDNVNIKFIPPVGWKTQDNSLQEEYGQIIFTPASSETVANLSITVLSASPHMVIKPEAMLEAIKQDETILNAEAIDFAGARALSTIGLISGIKTKQIQFYKDSNFFMITFLAEQENFDKFLPVVDESLKSFKVIPITSLNLPTVPTSSKKKKISLKGSPGPEKEENKFIDCMRNCCKAADGEWMSANDSRQTIRQEEDKAGTGSHFRTYGFSLEDFETSEGCHYDCGREGQSYEKCKSVCKEKWPRKSGFSIY